MKNENEVKDPWDALSRLRAEMHKSGEDFPWEWIDELDRIIALPRPGTGNLESILADLREARINRDDPSFVICKATDGSRLETDFEGWRDSLVFRLQAVPRPEGQLSREDREFLGALAQEADRTGRDFTARLFRRIAASATPRESVNGDDVGERAIVQLAGCLMASEGNTELDGQEDAYGWSPAYQQIVELYQSRESVNGELVEALRKAQGGCGGLLWLGNNRDKFEFVGATELDLFDSAVADAKEGYHRAAAAIKRAEEAGK